MQTIDFICQEVSTLKDIAMAIADFGKGEKIWVFEGEMAVGKTTLIRAICNVFGVKDNVSSPTFAIVNEYYSPLNGSIYHFDFYRIKDLSEAIDIGCEEYLFSGGYCLIEWPTKVSLLLPDKCLHIHLSFLNDNSRHIKISKHD